MKKTAIYKKHWPKKNLGERWDPLVLTDRSEERTHGSKIEADVPVGPFLLLSQTLCCCKVFFVDLP